MIGRRGFLAVLAGALASLFSGFRWPWSRGVRWRTITGINVPPAPTTYSYSVEAVYALEAPAKMLYPLITPLRNFDYTIKAINGVDVRAWLERHGEEIAARLDDA